MSTFKLPTLNKENGPWYVLVVAIIAATLVLFTRDRDIHGGWHFDIETTKLQTD